MTMSDTTTAEQVLTQLRRSGITLWEQDGQLRFRGPRGAMTAQRRAEVRRHSAEIVELVRDTGEPPAPQVTPHPEGRYEPFALTDIQAAYLIGRHDVGDYGRVACHAYLEVLYPPELEPERFVAAWHALVRRHDMLRAVVEPDGAQRVLADVPPLTIPVTDLTDGDDRAVTAHLDSQRAELDHEMRDTARWPLFEVRLTRTPTDTVMHLSFDSLIVDWGSTEVVLGDLDRLLADPDRRLPELEVTFRDYLLAEHALRDGERYRRDRAYWLDRVDAMPPAPDLPTVAIPEGPGRFVRRHRRMPADRWATFQERAREHGLTASAAVLACYAAVLERWSRGADFTVNVTVVNRLPLHPQVDRLVGDFTSVSLVAVRPDPAATFADSAAAVADELFGALDHRLFSGVEVVREVARRRGRDAAVMPYVFTSVLGMSAPDQEAEARRYGWGITQTPQVLIDCQVIEHRGGLELNWDVRDGAFRDGVVDDMFSALTDLLDTLVDDPAGWRSHDVVPLPAAHVAERERLRTTDDRIPTGLLHDEVFAQARRTPDALAVTAVDGSATYAELIGMAETTAANLRERGQRPGDLVGVALDKSIGQIAAVLGVLRAGGAYLPLDPGQPPARRNRMLADAGVRHVLVPADDEAQWPEDFVPVAVGGPRRAAPVDEPRRPDDLAYVIFTSGSTGRPKGVMITHRAARNTVQDIDRRHGVTGRDRVLGLAQLSFDLSVYDIFGPLAHGGTLVLPDPSRGPDPSHWAQLLSAHAVTLWNTVPAQLQMLVTYLESDPVPLPALRLALLSGDWIPISLPDRARDRLPQLTLVSLGGATEAAIWSIEHPIAEVDPGWHSIPYGAPLTNQDVRVLDQRLRNAPTWVTGELYISGIGLADGYLGDADLTAERFLRHPDGTRIYRTGDLGRTLPGGEIEFLGRIDAQVKIRGHRVELGEIEAALLGHPAVDAAAVVVDGDPRGDRTLLGFVEPARADPGAPVDGAERDRARLVASAVAAGEREAAGIDTDRLTADEARVTGGVLAAVLRTCRLAGLFALPSSTHRFDEVLGHLRPAAGRRWLVRAWISALVEHGVLVDDGDGLRCPSPDTDPEAWWAPLAEPGSTVTPGRLALLRSTADRLPELIEGATVTAAEARPDGGTGHGVVAEQEPVARYVHRAAAAALYRIATARRGPDRPVRVLEVGAGPGAFTAVAVPALAGVAAEYWSTDASPDAVAAARTRFGDRPWVRHSLFDVNTSARAQGLEPNSFDVVVCNRSLHAAADVPAAVRQLVELLAPHGYLVVSELTAPTPGLLFTEGFAWAPAEPATTDGPTADGPGTGGPSLSPGGWRELLDAVGGQELLCLPEDDHPLTAAGVRLFVAQVKTDRIPLRTADLVEHLRSQLPEYMVPAQLQAVDALPHTDNGKVDRRTLLSWRTTVAADDGAAADGPMDDLEERLAVLWRAALGVPGIGRSQSFFELGADSLVTARVAGQLREEVPEAAEIPFDVLLRQLLNEPTIGQLAAALRSGPRDGTAGVTATTADAADADAAPAGAAVDTDAGTGGVSDSNARFVPYGDQDVAGPLRVLFHAGFGTLNDFGHLSRALVAQELGPVVGIAIADAARYLDLASSDVVARLSADYADRLAATGHTRFQMIGYCLGGPIAVEVARALLDRGLDVVDLTLLDSNPLIIDTDEELLLEAMFVPNFQVDPTPAVFGDLSTEQLARALRIAADAHGGRVPAGAVQQVGGDPELDRVARVLDELASRDQAARMADYAAIIGERTGDPVEPRLLPALYRVFRQSLRGSLFEPQPYLGDITFLRASDAQPWEPLSGVKDPGVTHWSRVCLGEFTVHDVPGDHFGCLDAENAVVVAEHLERAVRAAG